MIPLVKDFIDIYKAYESLKCENSVKIKELSDKEYTSISKNWITKNYFYEDKHVVILYEPNPLADITPIYFTENVRFSSYTRRCPSAYDYYLKNEEHLNRKANSLCKSCPKKIWYDEFIYEKNKKAYWVRELIYREITIPATGSATMTKILCEFAQAKSFLDPSAGWADRVFGADAANVDIYHGFDPNIKLNKAYKKVLDFIDRPAYSITNVGFLNEDVILEDNFYDLVYTSPPFWNLEIYSDDQEQSTFGLNTIDEWKREFLFPYCEKAWKALKVGCMFMLFIEDVGKSKYNQYVSDTINYIVNRLNGTYIGTIMMLKETRSIKCRPIHIWKK